MTAIAESLFTAFAEGDDQQARQLCSESMRAIQNNARTMDLDALLKFAAATRRVVADYRYEDAIRTATDEGFIEEHSVCGTLADGTTFRIPACVVGVVEAGKITQLREYLDQTAAGPLIKALTAR